MKKSESKPKERINWMLVIIGTLSGSFIVEIFKLIFLHQFSVQIWIAGSIIGAGVAYLILRYGMDMRA